MRNGLLRHGIHLHDAHTAPALDHHTMTPGRAGPQVTPDSQDMLAGDCVRGAQLARATMRAGGACMHTGYRTPG